MIAQGQSPDLPSSEDRNTPVPFWRELFNRKTLAYLGPAYLVSVGYMDPGNWGTDLEGGARFGYSLLWVILLSNVMAIFLQSLSAKLGIVTGRTLPQHCRDHYSRPAAVFLWITAELAAMATDLAEFLGGALGLYLLFGIPLFPAALVTGAVVMGTLGVYRFGYRAVEYVILGYVTIIGLAYVYEVYLADPDWSLILYHTVVPTVNSDNIVVAVGILGATVMPHNIYLHSGLVQSRLMNPALGGPNKNHRHIRFALVDSFLALNMAWLVNSAILIMAAAVFHRHGYGAVSIEQAHETLGPLLGGFASLAFAVALLCSGLASSTTATLAGQIILEGFLRVQVPLWLRRLVTMIPALVVIWLGLDPLRILVLSQVALSLQLPFAIIPLIHFTRRRDIMGSYANSPLINALAYAIAGMILILNGLLLYQILGGTF